MTIEINLLPWREERRERRNKVYKAGLVASVLVGAGIGWGVMLAHQHALDVQLQRNEFIQSQARELDKSIQSVLEYRDEVDRMLVQIDLIRELQFSRPQTVRVFNQLSETLADGVHYTQLTRKGNHLHLSGRGRSNRHVSDQMRLLEAAEVFAAPTLSEVTAADAGRGSVKAGVSLGPEGEQWRHFDMSVVEEMPNTGRPQNSDSREGNHGSQG